MMPVALQVSVVQVLKSSQGLLKNATSPLAAGPSQRAANPPGKVAEGATHSARLSKPEPSARQTCCWRPLPTQPRRPGVQTLHAVPAGLQPKAQLLGGWSRPPTQRLSWPALQVLAVPVQVVQPAMGV